MTIMIRIQGTTTIVHIRSVKIVAQKAYTAFWVMTEAIAGVFL